MSATTPESAGHSCPWPKFRSRHREQSHLEAHATDVTEPPTTLQHSLVPQGEPTLAQTQSDLAQLIDHLRAIGRFGYDTEFIGEQSYYPELCLIQVSTPEQIALIDPLADMDLGPFWQLIADKEIETVVHAGLPDLEPVARHLHLPPLNIFDTQIAAAFAGLPYPMAMGKLVAEVTGAAPPNPSRSLKFSRWNQRPLSSAQLRYAADDVRYLPLLRHLLHERLHGTGHVEWVHQECKLFSCMDLYEFDAQSQRIRVRGIEKLSRRKKAVLHALVYWRDGAAREQNVPPRSLLRDEILFALASSPVQTLADLDRVSGLPRPVEHRYGQAIVDATAAALAAPPPPDVPANQHTPRIDHDEHRQVVDALWNCIAERCAERSIHPAIVTSKRELDGYLRSVVKGHVPAESRLKNGWRHQLLSDLLPLPT